MKRPTLLMLPGLVCDRAVWEPQIDALSDRVECVVPHYGELDSLAAMARHALETAPPGPLAVAGHSMGGRVAFEMLRLAPRRIERLALLDTSYHPLAPGEARGATQMLSHRIERAVAVVGRALQINARVRLADQRVLQCFDGARFAYSGLAEGGDDLALPRARQQPAVEQ